jgi:hypothetical protein
MSRYFGNSPRGRLLRDECNCPTGWADSQQPVAGSSLYLPRTSVSSVFISGELLGFFAEVQASANLPPD